MLDLKKLNDNCVIILPFEKKKDVLKEIALKRPNMHYKLLTKEDVIKGFSFSYDYQAIYFISKQFNYSYELAKEILINLVNIKPLNLKMTHLIQIYELLLENKLIKYNSNFINLFLNKNIYLYGYISSDMTLFSILKAKKILPIILSDLEGNISHKVITFDSIEDEVLFIFNDILKKYKQGIPLSKIYLYQYDSDYNLVLQKYAKRMGLPISYPFLSLYDTKFFHTFLELINKNNLKDTLDKLNELFKKNEYNLYNALIECINKINFLSINDSDFIKLLSFVAKNYQIKSQTKDIIQIVNYFHSLKDDEYVYMLGFSNEFYPVVKGDDDILTDVEKQMLGIQTSRDETNLEKMYLARFIQNTKNLIITFKQHFNRKKYFISALVKELNLTMIKGQDDFIRYSKTQAYYDSCKVLDKKRLYGIDNLELKSFSKETIGYMSYNKDFKEFGKITDDITLSYTALEQFYQCPFQYFVKHLLKVDVPIDSFYVKLGNFFHEVLSSSLNKTITLADYENIIDSKFLTSKERFFAKKLLLEVIKINDFNNQFLKESDFNNVLTEHHIQIQLDEKTKLVGTIDKVLFDQSKKEALIVDYKTSNYKLNTLKLEFGRNMQLLIYAYLLEKSLPNSKIRGLYYQNIINDPKWLEKNSYLLKGISICDEKLIKSIDHNLMDSRIYKSKYIDGITLTKQRKIMKNTSTNREYEEFISYLKTTIFNIEKAIHEIRNGAFMIKPVDFKEDIYINKKNQTNLCIKCNCKSICFKDSNEIEYISYRKEFEL